MLAGVVVVEPLDADADFGEHVRGGAFGLLDDPGVVRAGDADLQRVVDGRFDGGGLDD